MKIIVGLILVFFSQTLFSQTLSIYGGGGAVTFNGVENAVSDNFKNYVSPNLLMGVRYDFVNKARLGINVECSFLKSINQSIVSNSKRTENFQIDNRNGVLLTDSLQIQGKNFNHNVGVDWCFGYNIVSLFKFRIATEFGFGIIKGENRNIETWAINQDCVAQGDGYMNVYTHSWISSCSEIKKYNNIYVPVFVNAEYDITKLLSVGMYCKYKYMPYKDYSPNNLISFGGVVKFTLNRLPHLK